MCLGAVGVTVVELRCELHHAIEEGDGAVIVFARHSVAPQPHIGVEIVFVELCHALIVVIGEIVVPRFIVEVCALHKVVALFGLEENGGVEVSKCCGSIGKAKVGVG